MPPDQAHPSRTTIAGPPRRRAFALAYWNAGLWAIGNGLTSTTLVVYLALELGARGVAISLILAAPRLIGVLRMLTPVLVARLGDRRRFCLATYTAGNLLLLLLPAMAAPGVLSTRGSLLALIALWSGYHLLEYCATVALWAWLGDLSPRRIRSRFFGMRERWFTLGRIAGMIAGGLFAYAWHQQQPPEMAWLGYAVPAVAGTLVMLLSLVPLAYLPAVQQPPAPHRHFAWAQVIAPFFDRRFWPLMLFGVWFSFANGLGQSALAIYPKRILGFHLLTVLALDSVMRLGQSGVSPIAGRWADRFGNRPVMIVAQCVVASGPLFFWLATPARPWWLVGGWIAWIGYAGLNVALPNLNIKLAGRADSSAYLGAWFAVSGVVYSLSTIAGGILLDALVPSTSPPGQPPLDRFDTMFVISVVTRALAVLLLLKLIEPGAWRLTEILRRRRHWR